MDFWLILFFSGGKSKEEREEEKIPQLWNGEATSIKSDALFFSLIHRVAWTLQQQVQIGTCFILLNGLFCNLTAHCFLRIERIKHLIRPISGNTWKPLSLTWSWFCPLSPTGNTAVIPGWHWSHFPGLHQRRVGQWPRTHLEMGVVVLQWEVTPCLDNNPVMTQCLQYAKDNEHSVWVNHMESVHLHVRERKWKEEREKERERERLTDGPTWSQVHRAQTL